MEKGLRKENYSTTTSKHVSPLKGPATDALEQSLKRRRVFKEVEDAKKQRIAFKFDQLFNSIIASLNEDPFPHISWDFDD
jgi:hypothetical protein